MLGAFMGMLVPENRHWYGASRHTTYEEAKSLRPSSECKQIAELRRDSRLGEQQYNDATHHRRAVGPQLSWQVAARLRGCALLSSRRAKSRCRYCALSTSSTRSMPRNSPQEQAAAEKRLRDINKEVESGARRNFARVTRYREWKEWLRARDPPRRIKMLDAGWTDESPACQSR